MTPHPVCILTAGLGTRMGPLGDVVNKALLPLGERAIISHIIERFPEGTEFVIATGYKREQVKAYLRMAHRGVKFTFCDVENFAGPGSGPGLSLLACREALQRPFYFCPSDSLVDVDLNAVPDENWIALASRVSSRPEIYCNMRAEGGLVVDIADKQFPSPDYRAFTGLLFVNDHDAFWGALADDQLKAGEYQVSNGISGLVAGSGLHAVSADWTDLGDYETYKAANLAQVDFDFTKKDEFLYIVGGAVIKFFANPDIIRKRVDKSRVKPGIFPHIFDQDAQFYAYDLVPGETVYRALSLPVFEDLLTWLEQAVWTPADCTKDHMRDMCLQFYRDKTLARLAAFDAKYPDYRQPQRFNGLPIAPLDALLAKVDWDWLADGVPVFMHGDLQFDNIILNDDDGGFTLIDWRQEFAGEIAFGDIYYDLAKMLGGIWLNYDLIKKGRFSVEVEGDEMRADLEADPLSDQLETHLVAHIRQNGLDVNKVKTLVGIIFLNMSPLHEPPFDTMLHAYGRLRLQEALAGR